MLGSTADDAPDALARTTRPTSSKMECPASDCLPVIRSGDRYVGFRCFDEDRARHVLKRH